MSATTPESLPKHAIENFETLKRAFANGDAALVSSRDAKTGAPVSLVCAIQRNEDQTFEIVPLAIMIDGNPYEMFTDPTME